MSDSTIPITRPTSAASVVAQPHIQSTKQEYQYPTEWVDLPSLGYFYPENHPLSEGKVEVKMMTAKEEDILTNSNFIKTGVVLDRLLESVLINKSIKVNDFLVGDKNSVFVALRRLAYGDSYGPLAIKCSECRGDNKDISVNLADLKNKEINFFNFIKNINEFSFVLPVSKNKITFKLLTSKDEADIDTEIKVSQKLKLQASELTTRLRNCIVSVNDNTDKQYIKKFVENELLTRDSLALRTYMQVITPNIDMNFNFVCSHCGNEERIGVPLTAAFFWPDTTR